MRVKLKQNNIPDSWQKRKLSDIGLFSKGAGISKNDLSDKGSYAIRYGELYTRHHIKIKEIYSFIPEEIVTTTVRIKKGDILFAGSGETNEEIGKSAVYLSDEVCYAGGDTIIFSPKRDDSLFLAYALNVGNCRKQISEKGQGQSVVHVYKRDLEDIQVLLPPIDEQRCIIKVLETWDSYLEKLERKIEVKKNIKKGLMQQLLTGKRRLKGFKDEWKVVMLQSMGQVVTGNTPPMKDKENYGGQYCWATADDFTSKYIKETKIKLSDSGKNLSRWLPKGSLLITCIASIGKNAIAAVPLATNQQINAVIVNDKYNNEFLFYLLSNSLNLLRRYAGAGAMLILNKNDFSNVEFKVPQKNEQDAIANVLMKIDQEIEALEQKKEIIKAQKKFLLNSLITGKIRTLESIKV